MNREVALNALGQVTSVLFVLAVPVFLISASVTWAINDASLYNRGFSKYLVYDYTGITESDLRQAGADIRHYFNSRDEPLVLRARVFGEEREIFKQREVQHMGDVKRLVWGVYVATLVSGVYLATMIIPGIWRRARASADRLAWIFLRGGALTIALVLSIGLFALVGFDTLFLKFHQISFSNDFWQLDPYNDYLVIMFPQGFWFDATIYVAVLAVGGALLISLASGGYLLRRQFRSRPADGTSPVADQATPTP